MSNSKGYLLGKLFAQLQWEGAADTLGYMSASMSPIAIVPAFSRLAQMGKTEAIAEVMSELPVDTFNEQVLSPSDQADFPLGYYHENARMLRGVQQADHEEQYTALLLVRLEPSLKDWVMEQGGSKFVRVLLRAKRTASS